MYRRSNVTAKDNYVFLLRPGLRLDKNSQQLLPFVTMKLHVPMENGANFNHFCNTILTKS